MTTRGSAKPRSSWRESPAQRRGAVCTLFAEAGIEVSAFTFSAASLYSAMRLLGRPPAEGFLALGDAETMAATWKCTARARRGRCSSARLDQSYERARALALSELRLPPDTEPRHDIRHPAPAARCSGRLR